MHPRLPRLSNLLLTATALLALGVARVSAGPEGGNVVGGAATIQGQGGPAVIINQSSPSAIINWNTFNIRANESVRFNQPSSSSTVLNRVTGGQGPSEIMGTLTANGRVFIINRDGVLFGPGSVVNTAGFLATTSDIKNSDFMAGRYNFNIPGRPDASIVNQGRITATSGGFAALVAPGVRNSGTITATLGTVALASGNGFTLDLYGDKLITLAVNDQIASKVVDVATGQPLKSLVTNDGKIRANGGRVELTAAAARAVVDSVINTSGVIKANSIGHRNGMIVLAAATAGSKPAGSATQTIKISGTLSAAGKHRNTKGGTIVVSGENIKLANARVDASGRAGGGKVLIGGDWGGGKPNASLVNNPSAKLEAFAVPTATTVSVDAATTINASATGRGNGGKVVLWSDSQTTFAGTILARGGAKGGDGGFVETSSHGQLAFAGHVDASAPRGRAGTLLLDPADFFIRSSCQSEPSCGSNETTAGDIQTLLLSQNVVIATNNAQNVGDQNGDIFVQASINWGSDNSLTLSAYRNINISGNATISNTGAGNLILRADSTGTGNGTLILNAGTFANRIDYSQSTGTVSVFYNPTSYTSPTNYLAPTNPHVALNPTVNNQFTAYMLINTASNLDAVRTNTSGTYALGRNIDASSIQNFAPIPNFTGLLDGQNQTISNLTIASSGAQDAGLFGTIGSAGTVRNLNLANVSVTASGSTTLIGPLAGENSGTISNVHVLGGSVSGGSGIIAGGLVGQNDGLISGSSSAANVTVANFSLVGGLVGNNVGTIFVSSASGDVTGGAFTAVGGLAGQNAGAIAISSASGDVIAGGFASVGGLVGNNQGTVAGSSASGDVSGGQFASAGGLVGQNEGAITGSSASGDVTVGNFGWAGGLVGSNGYSLTSGASGSIENSFATGNVSSDGINVGLGGLVGFNAPGSTITASAAFGNVTATASVVQGGPNCAASNSCQYVSAGGLVGQNFGSIENAAATGMVSVGSNGTGGGLVGFNSGIIDSSLAFGSVTGSGGTGGINGQGGTTTLGGLAGINQGLITNSFAFGNVGNPNAGSLQVGGLVGDNSGAIASSAAFGNVQAGSGSIAGGLVGSNSNNTFNCDGCLLGDGFLFANTASIVGSQASGNVTVGSTSVAGGFAGASDGLIVASSATGAVTGGGNSVLGGFVGAQSFDNGPGVIILSTASGPVTSTGPNSSVGGFAGLNGGTISLSSASGAVTGTSDSYLGGFVGTNIGTIELASASGPVTGTGSGDIVGGFVGANFGSIDTSSASGNASAGSNSAVGGFAGANARFVNFPTDSVPGSSFPQGTITNSSASGSASGGSGSRVDPFIALRDPTTASNPPAFPSILAGCGDPTCVFLNTGILPTASVLSQVSSEFLEQLAAQQTQIILNLTANVQLAALTTPPVVNNDQGGIRLPPQQTPSPSPSQTQTPTPGNPNLPPGFPQRIIDIPPPTETRYRNDSVVLQIRTDAMARLQAAIANVGGLTVEASENLAILGSTAVKLHITNGQSVTAVLQAMAAIQVVAVAQPEYVFIAEQQSAEPAPAPPAAPAPAAASDAPAGDAAQYILEKLKISDVHRVVRGTNVPIAVIDSEIDVTHPDLEGVVAQRFSALGAPEKPHAHGTGMAGAIFSHRRLLGTAPASRLLAVHAFSSSTATAESTTFSILKGIDWSVSQGARIINMSFAGPKDPSLERALKLSYDKGIVLVAAAGNAGPKSPPLFPGADPSVIAVTATDVDDKLFAGANRGKYVSVAAPGVDILVPAPDNNYQLTTGTSVAAAEVSGIVALLLERNPRLTPADIRRILTASAKRLSPGDRDDNFGSGLIDPLKALQLADPRTATTTPTPAPAPALRQR